MKVALEAFHSKKVKQQSRPPEQHATKGEYAFHGEVRLSWNLDVSLINFSLCETWHQ